MTGWTTGVSSDSVIKAVDVVKESQLASAQELFKDSGINVTPMATVSLVLQLELRVSARPSLKKPLPTGTVNLSCWHLLHALRRKRLTQLSRMASLASGHF